MRPWVNKPVLSHNEMLQQALAQTMVTVAVAAGIGDASPVGISGPGKDMLDAMQGLFDQANHFDEDFLSTLYQCTDKISPDLRMAVENAWHGMLSLWESKDQSRHEWGRTRGLEACGPYAENQSTRYPPLSNMTIYEPCNYASNVAFYRVTTQICARNDVGSWNIPEAAVKALGQAFTHLAFGSAFYHGSHTYSGSVLDYRSIDLVAWILYQASISNLPNADNPVVKDLQGKPRALSSVQVAAKFTKMFADAPVTQWASTVMDFDMPGYRVTFGAIICQLTAMLLDDAKGDRVIDLTANAFGMPPEEIRFLKGDLLPELRNGSRVLQLARREAVQLGRNCVATGAKLLYAFLWQECVLTHNAIVFNPFVNAIGAKLLPYVNAIANLFSDFAVYDQDLQDGANIYPGDSWCNKVSPHAKWHLQAAVGLTDLVFLVDDVFRLTSRLVPGTSKPRQ